MTIIYTIGWLLAAITIVAFIHKAADNTCPECNGTGTIDHGFNVILQCPACNGEGKI